MKKRFIFLILLGILFSNLVIAEEVIEIQEFTSDTTALYFIGRGGSGDEYRIAQQFEANISYAITGFNMYLGSLSGTLGTNLSLYADNGANDTGAMLASDVIAAPTNNQRNLFNFSTNVSLTSGTLYWVIARWTAASDANTYRDHGTDATASKGWNYKTYAFPGGSGGWVAVATDDLINAVTMGFALVVTPSSFSVTSGNIFGQNNTIWNEGGYQNFSSNVVSFNFTCSVACNSTARLNVKGNHSQNLAANSNYLCPTEDTTDQSCVLYDNVSVGSNDFICLSLISSSGLESASGQCSAILNLTRIEPLNGSVVDSVGTGVNATVYIINLVNNSIEFNTTANSTGGFVLDASLLDLGIYLACSTNKLNYSQGADAKLINVSY